MKRNRNPAKENRPKHWFYMAYCAVAITVLGLITIIIGTVLVVMKTITIVPREAFNHDQRNIYLGRGFDRKTGWTVLAVGFVVSLLAYFVYKFALVRIDRYIDSFNEKHSRFSKTERTSYLMQ